MQKSPLPPQAIPETMRVTAGNRSGKAQIEKQFGKGSPMKHELRTRPLNKANLLIHSA
jgi:hypothetical protein